MTSKEEIALEITKSVIGQISFSYETVKTLPYEIYNSVYKNIETSKSKEPIEVLK